MELLLVSVSASPGSVEVPVAVELSQGEPRGAGEVLKIHQLLLDFRRGSLVIVKFRGVCSNFGRVPDHVNCLGRGGDVVVRTVSGVSVQTVSLNLPLHDFLHLSASIIIVDGIKAVQTLETLV